MDIKWIGAILIISACGGFGVALVSAHRREEQSLRGLIQSLNYMVSELHFRATPLSELCRQAAGECSNGIGIVFHRLSEELERNACPDVNSCMDGALNDLSIPPITLDNLKFLGSSLGRFDLDGQLKGLEAVREKCREDLHRITQSRDQRLRNYETLSLCAGAALAILLV